MPTRQGLKLFSESRLRPKSGRGSAILLGFLLPVPIVSQIVLGEGVRFYSIPLAGLGCLVVSSHLLASRGLQLRRMSGRLSILLRKFVIISLISVFIGVLRYLSASGILSFAYQLALMSYFLIGFALLREADDYIAFLKAIVISCTLCSIPVIIYISHFHSVSDIYALHNDLVLIRYVFGWPNAYGCFLSIALIFALLISSLCSTSTSKIFYWGCAAVLVIATILTFSRTAYIAVTLSIGMWLIKKRGLLRKTWSLAVLISLVLFTFLLVPDLGGFLQDSGTGRERLIFLGLVLQGLNVFDWIFGQGYQSIFVTFGGRAGEEVVPGLSFDYMAPHDEYLNMLLKVGIFGLVIFLLILVAITRHAYQLSVRHPDLRLREIYVHWFCALVPLLVTLFAAENLRYWPIAVVFWMFSGGAMNFQVMPAVASRSARNGLKINRARLVGPRVTP